MKKKIAGLGIYLVAVLCVLLPYLNYVQQFKFRNYFVVSHRNLDLYNPGKFGRAYPLSFYAAWDRRVWQYPYYPRFVRKGFWPILHHTLYGDYSNIQADSVTRRGASLPKDAIRTANHHLSRTRLKQLILLGILGAGISVFFGWFVLKSVCHAVIYFTKRLAKDFTDFILILALLFLFAQFFIYIQLYPEYVNIHFGYLFASVFVVCICAVRFMTTRWLSVVSSLYLFLYSGTAYLTFFKR